MSPRYQKLGIHQYHFSVSPADAISRHMQLIKTCLLQAGIESEIFASEIHPSLTTVAKPISSTQIWNCDLLLVHHSTGNPDIGKLLKIEVPKSLIFHNITPPEFFKHDPYLAGLAKTGFRQLKTLKKHVISCYGVSRTNQNILSEVGFRSPKLLPLVDLEAPTIGFGNSNHNPVRKKRLLFVGKITPHKNQALLIQMLHHLQSKFGNTNTELILVGRSDPFYRRYLELLVEKLGLVGSVRFTGKVTDLELANIYATSDAFVSLSLHEGFGVPLVEAMKFDLPIFALPYGAVPETIGNSGFYLQTECPVEIAATLNCCLEDKELLDKVVAVQTERLKELTQFHNKKNLTKILLQSAIKTRKPKSKEMRAP